MSTEQLIELCITAPCAVVLAVLVTVLFFELKRFDKKTKAQDEARSEQEKQQAALFEKLLGAVTDAQGRVDNLPVKCHSKEEETSVAEINETVRAQLDKLRVEVGANRIGFYYFHNGGYAVNGIPFAKMSLLLESLDGSSAPVMTLYQNMPRQLMPGVIEQIANDGSYDIDNIESIKDKDNSTYCVYRDRGTKTAYIKGIKDNIKDVYLGFISVEYSSNPFPKDPRKVNIEISKTVQRIAGAFQLYNDGKQHPEESLIAEVKESKGKEDRHGK
jgi:hypothetical protein